MPILASVPVLAETVRVQIDDNVDAQDISESVAARLDELTILPTLIPYEHNRSRRQRYLVSAESFRRLLAIPFAGRRDAAFRIRPAEGGHRQNAARGERRESSHT